MCIKNHFWVMEMFELIRWNFLMTFSKLIFLHLLLYKYILELVMYCENDALMPGKFRFSLASWLNAIFFLTKQSQPKFGQKLPFQQNYPRCSNPIPSYSRNISNNKKKKVINNDCLGLHFLTLIGIYDTLSVTNRFPKNSHDKKTQ